MFPLFFIMQINHTKALVLSSFNYRDYDRIVTYFTERYGVIKVLVRGGNRPRVRLFCEPLALLELTYCPKKNEIHSFREGKVIEAHLSLRDSYERLEAGMKLLNITAKSQFSEMPAPKIFLLLKLYLKKITEFKNLDVLIYSYLLKCLLLSGAWTIQTKCSKCHKLLEMFYYSGSGYFCLACTPSKRLGFDIDEIQKLSTLIHERSFKALDQLDVNKSLSEKIDDLFTLSYSS